MSLCWKEKVKILYISDFDNVFINKEDLNSFIVFYLTPF